MRDLADRVAAGEPPGGLQPQPLTPLLLSGCIPAPLRIPHVSVIRPRPPDVTTLSSTSSVWLAPTPHCRHRRRPQANESIPGIRGTPPRPSLGSETQPGQYLRTA